MFYTPPTSRRAKRCGAVLRHYGTDDTDRGRLIDFLPDARHWCDRHDESFALDRIAYQYYLAEREGDRTAAPRDAANLRDELRAALGYLLEQIVDMDLKYGIGLSEGEEDARAKALAVLAKTADQEA